MTVISRMSRLLAAAACVLLATVNCGCYEPMRRGAYTPRSALTKTIPQLQAEKKQLQAEIKREDFELWLLQVLAKDNANSLKVLRRVIDGWRADEARIEERARKLDVRIAAAKAKIRSSGATVVSPAPAVRALSPADRAALESTVLQLMKLEDRLMAQQGFLKKGRYVVRRERLRAQAHLIGLGQVIECLDLPAQVVWLYRHPLPAVKVKAEPLGTLATSSGMVRNDILLAAEQDASVSPRVRMMRRISERAEELVTSSERLGADLLRSDDPQVQALGRECQALAELFKHVKAVAMQAADLELAVVDFGDKRLLLLAKQSVGVRLAALWSAKTAADPTPGPDLAYARMVRTVEFVEWTAGTGWSAEAYLSARIRAVQRQRFGVADRLASP